MLEEFLIITNQTKCPKCGHEGSFSLKHCDSIKSTFYGSLCYGLRNFIEHIHVHCTKCHYEYLMKCADYKEE